MNVVSKQQDFFQNVKQAIYAFYAAFISYPPLQLIAFFGSLIGFFEIANLIAPGLFFWRLFTHGFAIFGFISLLVNALTLGKLFTLTTVLDILFYPLEFLFSKSGEAISYIVEVAQEYIDDIKKSAGSWGFTEIFLTVIFGLFVGIIGGILLFFGPAAALTALGPVVTFLLIAGLITLFIKIIIMSFGGKSASEIKELVIEKLKVSEKIVKSFLILLLRLIVGIISAVPATTFNFIKGWIEIIMPTKKFQTSFLMFVITIVSFVVSLFFTFNQSIFEYVWQLITGVSLMMLIVSLFIAKYTGKATLDFALTVLLWPIQFLADYAVMLIQWLIDMLKPKNSLAPV